MIKYTILSYKYNWILMELLLFVTLYIYALKRSFIFFILNPKSMGLKKQLKKFQRQIKFVCKK